MSKLKLKRAKQQEPAELKSYLQTSEEISDEMNEDIEHLVQEEPVNKSKKGFKFWKNWSRGKKIGLLSGSIVFLLLIISLLTFFVVRPAKTSSYIKESWHNLVSDSSSLDRTVRSEVNLEGTRSLADNLYEYNQKLSPVSYEAKNKNSLLFNTNSTSEYSLIIESLVEYFSNSAVILAKTNTDIADISDEELESLKSEGEQLKQKVDDFRKKYGLQEELNPNIFTLDQYILGVKQESENIAKEKAAEEQKEKDQTAKEAKDKADAQSVGESYLKAFVNGNEDGVRATLSKGYQGEYDYDSLKAERRTSYYPKSYRIVSVDKDGNNYKLTSSVTFVYVYQDSNGQNVESMQPTTLIYRVVFSDSTQSWKIDGQIDR